MPEQKSFLFILSVRGGGDVPPVVALALGLKARGHQVSVVCDIESARLISSTNLPSTTFPPPLDRRTQITRWIQQINLESDGPNDELMNPMVDWANPLVPFSEEIVKKVKPDLIVSTLFGIGLARELNRRLETPWCFVNPSFYFGDEAVRGWEEDWYGPYIPRLAKDCFLPLIKEATMVLHATDKQLDFLPEKLPNNHYYVGFLLWEPPLRDTTLFNEEGDPWALITLSSISQENEVVLAGAALQALADRPVRVLLTQPDKDIRDELSNLPSNATAAGYVPHTPILRKSALAINHAGHGIVSKALTCGVPMVLLPWDRDQPGVADRAERLGVARVVHRENVNPLEVQKAVDDVLDDPRYRKAAQTHAQRISTIDAVGAACSLLEDL